MNITNVKISRVSNGKKLEAMASVTIDNAIKIQGLKIVAGEKGYFVAMPSRQDKDGQYHDTVYPVTAEARKELIESVLDAFTKDRLERESAGRETNETGAGRTEEGVDSRASGETLAGSPPDLPDIDLPWEGAGSGGRMESAKAPEERPAETVPPAEKASAKTAAKAPAGKEKESIKEQLAKISESQKKDPAKAAKAPKLKKEEVSL